MHLKWIGLKHQMVQMVQDIFAIQMDWFNPNRPGLNSMQERLGQGYHNPALEALYPKSFKRIR